jgi:hypothetical protein
MFDSLNDEIKKTAGTETTGALLLRYAGIAAVAIVFMWGLYAGILYLE